MTLLQQNFDLLGSSELFCTNCGPTSFPVLMVLVIDDFHSGDVGGHKQWKPFA